MLIGLHVRFFQSFKYVSFGILHILKLSPLLLYYPFFLLLLGSVFVFRIESVCLRISMIMLFFLVGGYIPEKYDFYVSYYIVI